MEFDKSKVYTALNADELRAGDKVIVADTLEDLKEQVKKGDVDVHEIEDILAECEKDRFGVCGMANYTLASLVERAENCTNCGGHCEVSAHPELDKCKNWKPKTEQKAEPHYRPFANTDELIKVWDAKIGTPNWGTDGDLTMPHIWIREKGCDKSADLITCYGSKGITVRGKGMYFDTLFTMFEFLDGTPCGVEE